MDNDRDIKFDIVIGQPKFRPFSKWPPKQGEKTDSESEPTSLCSCSLMLCA